MDINHSFRLRLKVLLGISGLLLVVVLTDLYQFRVLNTTAVNRELFGEVQKLNSTVLSFKRSSENYQANVARDYESYYRDIQVFLQDLKGSLDQFDKQLNNTINDIETNVEDIAIAGIGEQYSKQQLLLQAQQAQQDWQVFVNGFIDALGEDEQEPRIEWGTRYIIENGETIENHINELNTAYMHYLDEQAKTAKNIFMAAVLLILILGLCALFWFYTRVTKRIGQAADACLQVANGDYGYTLPVAGQDELTVLSRAFNMLSNRSEMSLNMIANLQTVQSVEEALAVITRSSGGYLPIAWAGLLKADQTGDKLSLAATLPPQTRTQLTQLQINDKSVFGKQVANAMVSKKAFSLSSTVDKALSDNSDTFLRDMVRKTQIDALLCVPLYNHYGWEGMLLFGSRAGEYDPHQAELLERLGPVIATNLQRVV